MRKMRYFFECSVGYLTGAMWPDLTHHAHTKREEWIPYVKEHATTCYHAAGTCKMGHADDQTAVLDENLKVRGVKGLRVADTSVMPTLHGGHTQMPAYGMPFPFERWFTIN